MLADSAYPLLGDGVTKRMDGLALPRVRRPVVAANPAASIAGFRTQVLRVLTSVVSLEAGRLLQVMLAREARDSEMLLREVLPSLPLPACRAAVERRFRVPGEAELYWRDADDGCTAMPVAGGDVSCVLRDRQPPPVGS